MKTIGYIRVSTEEQASNGVSIDAQEAKIRAWASLNDCSDVSIYTDAGISGKRADNRQALQDALNACGDGDVLAVYSLSRLSRSTRDTINIAERLQKIGADLVSLSEKIDTTTAAGKMVFRMLAVLSEFERDQVSERTTMALAHKKAKGERVGSVPYGYKLSLDGITLVLNLSEQNAINYAKLMHDDGKSLREIATFLNENGYKPRGKAWYPATVKNLFREPLQNLEGD